MRKILVLGAGRSTAALVHYLVRHAPAQDWRVTVADRDGALAKELVRGAGDAARALALDATDAEARRALIAGHDLVVSMLPATMHVEVVRDCLRERKHAITPSYVSADLWKMDADLKAAGTTVLNEMGLDPGIDHMSIMRVLDRVRRAGGRMEALESHCGGLVAPESDDNPWGYKFSWNPRNVVLAGQGGAARYLWDGRVRYVPWHRLFQDPRRVEVPGWGAFEAYPNRDSLAYRTHYGLEDLTTLLRGTLRKVGFCEAWDALVRLGCTDDSYPMALPPGATWKDYLTAFLPMRDTEEGMRQVMEHMDHAWKHAPAIMDKLEWLGLFGDEPVGVEGLSPAATLQSLLERKWELRPEDKDLVVMWHRFAYTVDGRRRETRSWLALTGEDRRDTAMARTVGLPLAIAAKLLLNGAITEHGVLLPLSPSIHGPVLDELEENGIAFNEEEEAL